MRDLRAGRRGGEELRLGEPRAVCREALEALVLMLWGVGAVVLVLGGVR